MELFKFNFTTDPTVLESGQFINKAKSVMWTERYQEPGEFEIVSMLSSGMRDFLPLGTLISHTDTYEVMIVENHEIKEKSGEDPELVITGRSFETFLEFRSIGMNGARTNSAIAEYILPPAGTGTQVVKMINDHIVNTANADDALVNVSAITSVAGGVIEERNIARGNVHSRILEILAIEDFGIKTVRRNPFGPGSSTQTILQVHSGVDRSSKVIWSWKAGDLDGADYLFSNKRSRNTAMVAGRYVYTIVDTPGLTKYNRRVIFVNANDIDGHLNNVPTGGTLTDVINKMQVRGRQALKNFNDVTISRADISNLSKYQYRKDFNVGDLITLDANFGQSAIMRVTEYVEIEDENGESGHPTLSTTEAYIAAQVLSSKL